jgi:hypothetical protein
MVSASLVRDKESNLKQVAFRKAGKSVEYEFTFPYQNGDLGDTLWKLDRAYQIAILVGPGERFQGINQDTWMSDQIYIRLGSRSKESIYHPAFVAEGASEEHH